MSIYKFELMSITELRDGILSQTFSAESVAKYFIDRIKRYDGPIGSFVIIRDDAVHEAQQVDKKIMAGQPVGLLAGIPVAIKDNISTKGMITSCGSKMLADYISPYDASVIQELKAQDGIIIGKTNMDEFAMGSSTETSYYGITRNPYDLTRVPGGSSGGSAAAVSAGFAPLSLGSDTGGSIRQPASYCGIVGLKPTYGSISRYGLVAFASSLDQVGPMTKCVEDAAIGMMSLAQYDEKDSTSVDTDTSDYISSLKDGIQGLRVAVPTEFFQDGLDPEIKTSVFQAIEHLKSLGASVSSISLPFVDTGLSAYYVISSAEASSNLARYDGVVFGHKPDTYDDLNDMMLKSRMAGFGTEVKRRIMLGTYVLSSGFYDAYYKKAMAYKESVKLAFASVFEDYDVIISPTSPVLPFKLGEKIHDPLDMYLADIYTVNVNIAGLPALSIPSGMSKSGLPMGLQLIGKHHSEATLLRTGYALEKEISFDTSSVLERRS